jgi:hypothetical protein
VEASWRGEKVLLPRTFSSRAKASGTHSHAAHQPPVQGPTRRFFSTKLASTITLAFSTTDRSLHTYATR